MNFLEARILEMEKDLLAGDAGISVAMGSGGGGGGGGDGGDGDGSDDDDDAQKGKGKGNRNAPSRGGFFMKCVELVYRYETENWNGMWQYITDLRANSWRFSQILDRRHGWRHPQ